ncbi:hypothetical protein AB9M75_08155 [Lactobacillus sp. AN1001]
MKQIVKTFGGAVTYLKDEFGTFDISSKREEILRRIKDDPNDETTAVAWESFLKGTQQLDKEGKERSKKYELWIAKDNDTGQEYKATSAEKLAALIGFTGVTVRRARSLNRLIQHRYIIVCKEVKVGANTGAKRYIWMAEDQDADEILKASSARELGDLIGTTDSGVIWAMKQNKLAAKRYKITRKIAQ